MTHSFNPTILREYDIRGIVGDTLTDADAYALGRSYAALAREEGARKIAVGRDGRTHSPMLEDALVRGLTEGGIDVVTIGMGPSPMLYFATHELDVDGGIQVTGSHNPAAYNGFKLLLNGRSVFGEEIQALGRRCAVGEWGKGEGRVEEADVAGAYVDRLVEDFRGGAFRVGWDAGNGAAGTVLEELVQRLPGEHRLPAAAVDRDDGDGVTHRVEFREVAAEFEPRCRRIGIARLDRRDIGARDAISRRVRPAVDANLDALDSLGSQRPAADAEIRVDDGFVSGRIDRAHGIDARRPSGRWRCRRSNGVSSGGDAQRMAILPRQCAGDRQACVDQQPRSDALFPGTKGSHSTKFGRGHSAPGSL